MVGHDRGSASVTERRSRLRYSPENNIKEAKIQPFTARHMGGAHSHPNPTRSKILPPTNTSPNLRHPATWDPPPTTTTSDRPHTRPPNPRLPPTPGNGHHRTTAWPLLRTPHINQQRRRRNDDAPDTTYLRTSGGKQNAGRTRSHLPRDGRPRLLYGLPLGGQARKKGGIPER